MCAEFPADPAWKFPAPGVKPLCCFPSFGASLCYPPPAPLETAVSEPKGARGSEDGCGGRRGAGLSPLLQPAAAVANLCVKSLGSWCGDAGKWVCAGTRETDKGVGKTRWSPPAWGLFWLRQVRCGGARLFPPAFPSRSALMEGPVHTYSPRLPETCLKAWSRM